MKMKKMIASLCAAAVMTLTFAGCTIIDNSAIATVDGNKITSGEFQLQVQGVLAQKEAQTQVEEGQNFLDMEVDGKKMTDIIKEESLEQLVEQKVAANEAKKEGMSLTDEEKKSIDDSKSSMIKNMGGKDAYEKVLKSYGLTEKTYDALIEENSIYSKFYNQKMEEMTVTDEEAKAEFESKYLRAKHILITVDTETTDEAAQAKAQELLDQINGGADFDALMKENSKDPGLESQPDGYIFTDNGAMIKEFQDAAFALEVGQVSNIVKTTAGYHIIKREALLPESFEENKETVISSMKQDKFKEYIETLKSSAKIEKDEKAYNNFKVEKIEEGA